MTDQPCFASAPGANAPGVFLGGNMEKIVLKIKGMGCEMCVNKVTAALSAVESVT